MSRVLPAALLLALALGACGKDEATAAPAAAGPLLVCTTSYPLYYLAKRIAGDLCDLECVTPRDQDPLHWQPDRAAIQRMQAARLLLLNGAGAETWTTQVALPLARVVETAEPFADRFIPLASGVTHSHGPGDVHTHEGVDPHTWMDPKNAKQQAEAVLEALSDLLPAQQDTLAANFQALAQDLDALHARFLALGAQADGEVLVASHGAYNYIQKRYGWNVVTLDIDPAAAPSGEELAAIHAALDGKRARFVLWEQAPVPELAKDLERDLGLQGILFSPCESLPAAGEPDYLAAMNQNLDRVEVAFPDAR